MGYIDVGEREIKQKFIIPCTVRLEISGAPNGPLVTEREREIL